MDLFRTVKRKMAVKYAVMAAVSAAFFVFTVFFIGKTGFSSDSEFAFQLSPVVDEVMIPNSAGSVLMILFAAFMLAAAAAGIYFAVKNPDYKDLLESVKKIGDPCVMNALFGAMEKDPNAKGDLRYNGEMLFYMKGSSASVIKPQKIKEIKVQGKVPGGISPCTVNIFYDDKVLGIRSRKDTADALSENLNKAFAALILN